MPSPALRETQRRFWTALSRGGRPAAPVVGRFGVYADAYPLRLGDVLREDYPRLARVLGDERFTAVATAYLRRHPSEHPSLRHFGRRLPAYLAARRDLPPCLADLARLELARTDAFDAADAEPLAAAALRAVPAHAWPALVLRPVPSLRLLRLTWPAQRLWSGDGTADALPRDRTWLRVWRAPDDTVLHAVLDSTAATVLRRLLTGAPFARLCEPFRQRAPGAAAAEAIGLLARWLEDGMLVEPLSFCPH